MRRTGLNKSLIFIAFMSLLTLLAQSCSTSKKGCGCGTDINRVNRYH